MIAPPGYPAYPGDGPAITYSDLGDYSGYSSPIPVVIGTARVKGTPIFLDNIRASRVLLPDSTDPTTWKEQDGKVVTGVLGLCEGPIPLQSQTNLVWFNKWAGSRLEACKKVVARLDYGTIFSWGGDPRQSVNNLLVMWAQPGSADARLEVGDLVYSTGLKRTGWITAITHSTYDNVETSLPMTYAEKPNLGEVIFYRPITVDAGSRTGSDWYTTPGFTVFRYTAVNNSGSASVFTMKSDSAVPVAGDFIYHPGAGVGDYVVSVTGGTTVTMVSKKSWPTPSGYAAADLYHVAQGVNWDSKTRSGVVHFAGTATARSRDWVTQSGNIDDAEFEITGFAASVPTSVERPKTVCSPSSSKAPTQVTVVTGGTGVSVLTLGAGETANLQVGDRLTQGAASSTIYSINNVTNQVTLDTAGTWTTAVAEVTMPRTVLDAHPADAVVAILTDPVWGLGWDAARVDVDHGSDLAAASSFRTYCTALGFRVSGLLSEAQSAQDIVRSILEACNSVAVETSVNGVPAIRVIPWGDDPVTANGVTFTPPTATPYTVNESNLVVEEAAPPIRIERGSLADVPNVCPVSYLDRAKDYDQVVVEYMDAARVEDDGRVKRAQALEVPWVISGAQAMALSQALVQRGLALTNTLTFKLPPTYGFLEPMDFLVIDHELSGYAGAVVRITAIDENADGELEVAACEWPLGIGRTGIHEEPVVDGTGSSGGGDQYGPQGYGTVQEQLAAMADDGIITPAEKKTLWPILKGYYAAYTEMVAGYWMTGDAVSYPINFGKLWYVLERSSPRFSHGWFYGRVRDPAQMGIVPTGTMVGDWAAELATWMTETDVLVGDSFAGRSGAEDWRYWVDIIEAQIATFRQHQVDYLRNGLVTFPGGTSTFLRADGTFATPAGGGTVTSVTGTAPVTSSGGSTPAIGISAASTSAAGSMSAADKTKLDSATSANTASVIVMRDASGWIYCTDLSTSSDRRTKRKVRNLRGALARALGLRGVSFERRGDKTKAPRVGLIAQEVQQVLPEVVVADEKGMLSVSYGPIVALIIEALREIVKRLDRLEARK